jgi:zinc-binding in reverse transcriptase
MVEIYLIEWDQLVKDLDNIVLSSTPDFPIWRWTTSGKFSVHSMYEWLDFDGIISNEYDIVWKSKISYKIRIFMWLMRKK